jgi:alkaline phosphatase
VDSTSTNTGNTIVSRSALGNFSANVITATTFNGALTGNAASATRLNTPRNINNIAFDGTADITIPAVTSVVGGAGLIGTVTTAGSLAVGAGTGITVNADDVAVNRTITDTWYVPRDWNTLTVLP